MSLFPCYEANDNDNITTNRENKNSDYLHHHHTPQNILMSKNYFEQKCVPYTSHEKKEEEKVKNKEKKEKKLNKKHKKEKKNKRSKKKRSNSLEENDEKIEINDSSDFDSFDESDTEKDNSRKKLLLTNAVYLPNGNIILRNDQSESEYWKIDKKRDEEFLQLGSFYRLDIPEYDVSYYSHTGEVKKRNPVRSSSKWNNPTDTRYSLRYRYFNDSSSHKLDSHIYRPRGEPSLTKPEKKINQISFMIPLPPPLPSDESGFADQLNKAMKSDVEVLLVKQLFLTFLIDIQAAIFRATYSFK